VYEPHLPGYRPRGVHALLLLLLGLGVGQLLVALVAIARGRRSHRAGAVSLARYSFAHAALLAAGSVVLAVPIVLGLTDVIAEDVAIYSAVGLEIVVLPFARMALDRFEAAHHARRPA
jgi:hypothetical protein